MKPKAWLGCHEKEVRAQCVEELLVTQRFEAQGYVVESQTSHLKDVRGKIGPN